MTPNELRLCRALVKTMDELMTFTDGVVAEPLRSENIALLAEIDPYGDSTRDAVNAEGVRTCAHCQGTIKALEQSVEGPAHADCDMTLTKGTE